jgi:uncharacterized protein (TIGR02646 family)
VIRVKLGPIPVDLDGPDSKGEQEIAAAVALYADPANAKKPFPFVAYKADSVKTALNTLFSFKCAYCESVYGATQPLDVEHFRPKSGFNDDDGDLVKPGYYWLAARWRNLLPSCTDCNRQRRQRLADGRVLVSGKANQFPIADEAKRARKPGQEKTEPRLLLHPVLDEPRRHLEFDADEGIVRPLVAASGGASRKGATSIEVYALLRDGLVRARKARQKLIRKEIAVARGLAQTLDQIGPNANLEQMLRESLSMLRDYMSADAPYAAMARQMIEPVLAELTG